MSTLLNMLRTGYPAPKKHIRVQIIGDARGYQRALGITVNVEGPVLSEPELTEAIRRQLRKPSA